MAASPLQILQTIFTDQDGALKATLGSIEKMCRLIDSRPSCDFDIWLNGPCTYRSGRPRMMPKADVRFLRRVADDSFPRMKMRTLHREFVRAYYNIGDVVPSRSTVSRTLRLRTGLKPKLTRKALQRVHRAQEPTQIQTFLERAAPFPAGSWMDIDEMKQVEEDFLQHRGYAPEGEPAVAAQFKIGDRAFSVIAAMVPAGFAAWTIFDENVTSMHVENFITTKVAPLAYGKRGLLDNATTHHNPNVYAAMDAAFAGQWLYCSPYSPHLKPIERGFNLIKQYIQDHEVEAVNDPVKWINKAFQIYSVLGPRGGRCRNFFNTYERLHQSFLDGNI